MDKQVGESLRLQFFYLRQDTAFMPDPDAREEAILTFLNAWLRESPDSSILYVITLIVKEYSSLCGCTPRQWVAALEMLEGMLALRSLHCASEGTLPNNQTPYDYE